jgi:hypothetical protein
MKLLVESRIQLKRTLKNGVKATATIEYSNYVHALLKMTDDEKAVISLVAAL